jgi:hypothetical protein
VASHGGLYTLTAPVGKAAHTADYSLIAGPVAAAHTATANLRVSQAHGALNEFTNTVRADFGVDYTLRPRVAADQGAVFSLTDRTATDNAGEWSLNPYDRVTADHHTLHNLTIADVVQISDEPLLQIAGEKVELLRAEVGISEGDFGWTCTIEIADPADYRKFTRDSPFSLTLAGEVYQFLLDSKTVRRGGPDQAPAMSLLGVSPTAAYASPRATRITKTWETAESAKSICETLLATSIDWQIVDWIVPAFRLGVVGMAPLDVVKLVVKAAGGVIETSPGGALQARYLYPVAVPQIPTSAVDHTYTDDEDNFEITESFDFREGVNEITVRDVAEGGFRDTIEFVEDEARRGRKGTLRVYPSPRRDVIVKHTGLNTVLLVRTGQVLRTEEELVEVFDGRANLRYPITALNSISWEAADLGGVAFNTDGTVVESTHPTDKFSLLRINYVTTALEYETENPVDGSVQYLVEDQEA